MSRLATSYLFVLFTFCGGVRALLSNEFHVQTVQNEFIFTFDKLLDKSVRHSRLIEALEASGVFEFSISAKNQLVDSLPSDFDVVKSSLINESNFELIKSQDLGLKLITRQKQVRKLLKSVSQKLNQDNEYEEERRRDSAEQQRYNKRRMFKAIPRSLVDQLRVKELWSREITGFNVNVAIFDTGLESEHPHFKNVVEITNWTEEKSGATDHIGHGTFVSGLVAGTASSCPGLAPDVNLYIFKVFTDQQVSYTSWFLDAFNYAMQKNIDVLNLSIGGPDFMDTQFVDKVWQVTSKNIIMVSGIGNDGPLYGTLNNPADQSDVIGVGGINSEDYVAKFSSRGMTTWELPNGYGRVKPDIMTLGTFIEGSSRMAAKPSSSGTSNGCRTLSGTSVASPIVAGAAALLVDAFRRQTNKNFSVNPAVIKQVLLAGASRLSSANMFEQGFGKLDLVQSMSVLNRYTKPQASLIPSYLDLTECPYFWPYCSQPMYFSSMPVVVNVTILNAMSVEGRITQRPRWFPLKDKNYLRVKFSYSEKLWPWSGYLAVEFEVSKEAAEYSGEVEGLIKLQVESLDKEISDLSLYVKVRIVPTPARQQRILWDQWHNLRYPKGYFPRDNLQFRKDPLDWNGDHIHTNFKDMYSYLRNAGFFIEVLGSNYNCFDASNYGALMIVDPEEEFHPSEIKKLYEDVTKRGLSLVVFADWHNNSVIKAAKFFDENSREWWTPVTGGSNLPALNQLLQKFGAAFGDKVYEGKFKVGEHSAFYASGTSLVKFPRSKNNYLISRTMLDHGEDFLAQNTNHSSLPGRKDSQVALLGLLSLEEASSGRLALYGDSNCIDSAQITSSGGEQADCFWLLSAILEYTNYNNLFTGFKESTSEHFENKNKNSMPTRPPGSTFYKYSKLMQQNGQLVSNLPDCPVSSHYEPSHPIQFIPTSLIPNKDNLYNFLKLSEKEAELVTRSQMRGSDRRRITRPITSSPSSSSLLVLLSGILFLLIYIFVKNKKNMLRRSKSSRYFVENKGKLI